MQHPLLGFQLKYDLANNLYLNLAGKKKPDEIVNGSASSRTFDDKISKKKWLHRLNNNLCDSTWLFRFQFVFWDWPSTRWYFSDRNNGIGPTTPKRKISHSSFALYPLETPDRVAYRALLLGCGWTYHAALLPFRWYRQHCFQDGINWLVWNFHFYYTAKNVSIQY